VDALLLVQTTTRLPDLKASDLASIIAASVSLAAVAKRLLATTELKLGNAKEVRTARIAIVTTNSNNVNPE